MDSERWKQVDSLLQAALERPPADRDAFIRQAGDAALEREVRSLLMLERQAEGFLETPAIDIAARAIAPTQVLADSLIGQAISHYRVVEKLGGGGMGVVYKAEDTQLQRFVALKFLQEQIARDPRALRRFEREARAASALNHPNICTIHHVEQYNRQPVIVMELLEGESLKQRIRRGSISMDEILDFGIQTSEALEAAHATGIVHRDIKPANLFITRHGQAKILDFGLAKAADNNPAPNETTLEAPLTASGDVVGTVAYMSPEQIRAKQLDARSDLFSFGAVLYEMATGQQPFRGESTGMIFDSILNRAPVPTAQLAPDLPSELDRIIGKCLEKDRNLRYQHAADLRADLRRLKRDSDSLPAPAIPDTGAKRSRVIIPAAAALLACLAAGYFYLHRTPKLTDKDTIVLGDFRNTTGDPVFDGALRQGLAVELSQSPFLSLISDARIQRTLAQMQQPPDSRLTPALSREICERTGSAAFLEGSIESLGSQYVLGLRAENCHTGDVLADEQARASRKEDVLDALSHITSRFRTRVGEALATVRRHETPLDEATTSSLEALKAYSTAATLNFTKGPAAAIPHYQRAIATDQKFAIAYAYLGLMYSNLGESELAAASTRRAWELRDRASDREKFNIALTYDRQVTGNLERENQTAALWAQTYPRDVLAHGLWAGFATAGTGQFEKSIEEAEITIRLDPDQFYAYVSIAAANLNLGRLADVESTFERATANHMDMSHPQFSKLRFFLAFLRNDQVGMDREVAQSRNRLGVEDAISHLQALTLARAGRLRQAEETWQHAIELASQTGHAEEAGMYEVGAAVSEALYGRAAEARKHAHEALERSKGRDVEYGAAFAFALAGDSAAPQALAADLKKRFPEDTSVQFSYLPTLDALFALPRGDHAKAIEALEAARAHESGLTGIRFFGWFGGLHSAFARGQAYAKGRQDAEAAAEFGKLVDHPGIVLADPIGVMARLELGRLHTRAGDTDQAKAAYQEVLAIWKDADPGVPVIDQARTEFAKLQPAKN